MPQVCRVCKHPDREAIDRQLVIGTALDALGGEYGVSRSSLTRHKANHVSEALHAVVVEEREKAGPRSALDRLEELYDTASRILAAAEQEGKASLSLSAVRELRGITETLAKVTGEINDRPQLAVFQLSASPEWAQTRDTVFRVLEGFPDARVAVAQALAVLPALEAGVDR